MSISKILTHGSVARDRIIHLVKRFTSNLEHCNVSNYRSLLPKIYIYDLPKRFMPTHELPLVSETFYAIYDFIRLYCRTYDPHDADYYLIPMNLIQFQFRNEDPSEVLDHLNFYSADRNDHLLIALGDYSQRSKLNHYGHAYLQTYQWINNIILLALESTSDLIKDHDIGIIPFNTLSASPLFNWNERRYLYSFYGKTDHMYLPDTHIRNKIREIVPKHDIFIGDSISKREKADLQKYFYTKNNFELISRNSIFTLAPAGYGRWTYRFFQAIQWGSIPVLLSDDYIKPFDDSIPYDDFCITVSEVDIGRIDDILRSYSTDAIKNLQNSLYCNLHHFTQEAFFTKLCTRLKQQSYAMHKET